jgi:hypothetical protein
MHLAERTTTGTSHLSISWSCRFEGFPGETEIQERIELQSYPRSAPDLTIRCASMVKDRTISFAFVADERPRAELYTGPRSHEDLGGLCVSRLVGRSCGLESKKPAPWPEAGGVPGVSAVVVAIGMCRLRVQPPCQARWLAGHSTLL